MDFPEGIREAIKNAAARDVDLLDLALILARDATDTGGRTSLDDVIASLGFTRDQLAAEDDQLV